jgi:predicted component of type VI protein secretion system
MPKIHILSGVLEGKVIDLIEERITLGRAVDNMIRLEDGTCSHHHALLIMEAGEYKLRDLNSTNGTRVNGLRIVETKLHNGDQVRLGSVEMRFESDARKASQPLPPVQTGVDLSQTIADSAPPPTFGSASPFGRKKKNKIGVWVWVVIGLSVVALGVLAYFILKFISVGGAR